MTIKISVNLSPVAAASVGETATGFGSPYLALQ